MQLSHQGGPLQHLSELGRRPLQSFEVVLGKPIRLVERLENPDHFAVAIPHGRGRKAPRRKPGAAIDLGPKSGIGSGVVDADGGAGGRDVAGDAAIEGDRQLGELRQATGSEHQLVAGAVDEKQGHPLGAEAFADGLERPGDEGIELDFGPD
jgi:hypothetical protein